MKRSAVDMKSARELGPAARFFIALPPRTTMTIARFPIIAGGGRGHGSRRTGKDHAVLSITVSAGEVLSIRKAVYALAHPAVDLLTVTPLPGGSRVRLTIYLASDVVDVLTKRILEFVAERDLDARRLPNPKYADDAQSRQASATVV